MLDKMLKCFLVRLPFQLSSPSLLRPGLQVMLLVDGRGNAATTDLLALGACAAAGLTVPAGLRSASLLPAGVRASSRAA